LRFTWIAPDNVLPPSSTPVVPVMADRGGVYRIGGGSVLGPILASRGTL
jgi:hypothetical protein